MKNWLKASLFGCIISAIAVIISAINMFTAAINWSSITTLCLMIALFCTNLALYFEQRKKNDISHSTIGTNLTGSRSFSMTLPPFFVISFSN